MNTASRIEEAGQPDEVTVSEAVIERIGNEFVHTCQARVRLRGVGSTVRHSIEGRRVALNEDQSG